MSTKIYNAYTTTASLTRIYTVMKALRAPMMSRWKSRMDYGFNKADAEYGPNKGASPEALLEREKIRLDHACRLSMEVISGYSGANPTCEVAIYPIIKKSLNFHVGATCVFQLFGVDRDFEKGAIKALKGKDFHYQNQCDPDEKAEASGEWDYRKKFWDKMFKDSSFPCDNSFGLHIVSKKHALEAVWERHAIEQNRDRAADKQWDPLSCAIWRGGDLVRSSPRSMRKDLVECYPDHLKEYATNLWITVPSLPATSAA